MTDRMTRGILPVGTGLVTAFPNIEVAVLPITPSYALLLENHLGLSQGAVMLTWPTK